MQQRSCPEGRLGLERIMNLEPFQKNESPLTFHPIKRRPMAILPLASDRRIGVAFSEHMSCRYGWSCQATVGRSCTVP
jgi:hypothetical protein